MISPALPRATPAYLCAILLCLLSAAVRTAGAQQPLLLNKERVHLGQPDAPEWEEFATGKARPGRFEMRFQAEPNATDATLLIRQDDVRKEWRVELNRRRIGRLFEMEADLIHTIALPPGALLQGENILAILPPLDPDDILLHEVIIEPRPVAETLQQGRLTVTVTDENGRPLPARITIVNERGALAPIAAAPGAESRAAVRPGVAYTGDGRAELGLRAGRHTIFASRGFEYSAASKEIDVPRGGKVEAAFRLVREVPTPGMVSCDTHVHTFTHSRHGDAAMDERMLTLAGEGIELPIATDHNVHADFSEPARAAGVQAYFTPVTGNEVTTKMGHFNIFPIAAGAPVVDAGVTDWPQLMTAIRATPGVRVVILNHPRSVHTGFRPFDPEHFNSATGQNKRGPEFTFDAVELLNSSAQQSDYMLVYRDWFALLNHGHRITGVGSSDSHDVSRYIVGQGRTYLAAPDADPGAIDVEKACESLLAGRAWVSMGLLVDLKVEEKFGVGDLATQLPEIVRVQARVLGPSWTKAARVVLYANGAQIREAEIDAATASAPGEKALVTWMIPRPRHDVHLVAIATGPGVTAPFWAIPRPYQPSARTWTGRVIGSTNPLWLDADGDGKFTPARGYARQLIQRHGVEPARLLPELAGFDEAVAAQAASFCADAGAKLDSAAFSTALKAAAPQVADGFSKYLEAAGAGAAPEP